MRTQPNGLEENVKRDTADTNEPIPDDLEVTDVLLTPCGSVIISYKYTKDGRSIGRSTEPVFINKPPKPPIDLGSIWD